MASFSAIDYARNIGKSAKYITTNTIKKVNPTLTQYVQDNATAVRDMYDTVKDYAHNSKGKANDLWKGEAGKFGRDIIKNALDDIKSGKFYNEERASKALDSFMDIDVDFDSEDNQSGVDTADQTITSSNMDRIMAKASKSNANIAITSADIVSKNLKISSKVIMAHNERMTGHIVNSIAAVHSSIVQLNQDLVGPLNTHIQNSTTFYKTATEQLALQTGYLKELKELFVARYGGSTKSTGGFSSNSSAWKKITGGGLPDLIEMGRGFKNKIKNETSLLSMITSFIDDDTIKMARMSDEFNSPIAALISTALATGLGRSRTGRGLDRFVNNLTGMFATGLGRASAFGKSSKGMNSMILGPLARALSGFIPKKNMKFDTGKYEKGRVDWTGMADKALREVIPTQLAQILSALTGQEPKIFDYNTGRWTTAKNISASFRTGRRNAINASQSGFRDEVINRFNTAYGASSRSKATKSFKQDYDNLMEIIARTNVDPTNPTELRNYLKRKGLIGSGDKFYIHEENFDRIMQILGFSPSGGKFGKSGGLGFGFAKAAYDAREANSDYMNAQSAAGGAYSVVRSGAFGRKSVPGGIGLASVTDDKGHNVFFYLQSFYSDLKRIANSLSSGGGRSRKAGRRKYGAASQSFEVPDYSKKSNGFKSSTSTGNVYYDPELEENINAFGGKKEEQTIFDRAASDEGLSEEEIAAMNPLKRFAYRQYRKVKNWSKRQDTRNTIFDNLQETLMDITFGKERDSNIFKKGLVGVIQELPDRISEALHNLGNRLWDLFRNSKLFNSAKDKIKNKWNEFRNSEGFNRFKSEFKSSTSGFMSGAFAGAYKDFKSAFGAVRSHGNTPNEPGTAAYGGTVLKSGVVSVSEGEYIVPAEYNPYYTGHMGKSSRRAIESFNKRGFLNSASSKGEYWGSYADGGTVSGFFDRFRKDNKGKDVKYKSKTFKAARFAGKVASKLGRKAAEEGREEARNIAEDVKSTEIYQDLMESINGLKNTVKGFTEKVFGDQDWFKKGKETTKSAIGIIKPYLPETLAGGAIGSLIGGAATGSPLGLLGGFVIGSGISLAKHSDQFSKILFGDVDEAGNRTGGVFNAKVSNFLTKRFPKMAKTGAVGSVLGALGIAPGGILGGFVIGAGLDLLSTTDKFKDFMFGHAGADGKRRGGLTSSIQLRIVDPLANYIQKELKGLNGYIKKNVLDPISNLFNPLRDWAAGMFSKARESMDRAWKDRIVAPLAEKLDTILKPITGIAGWVGKKMVGLGKGILSVPGRAVTGVGNRLQLHNIRMGYSTLTPEERLQFMNQHSVRAKGSNLAANIVNKIPGGSRVTGAVGGFLRKHETASRRLGFGMENQKYTEYAANASAEDLENLYYSTIGRESSIREVAQSNNKVRQNLRDTLIGTMKDGGLGDARARRELRKILDSNEARYGGGSSIINDWIDRQVKSGQMDKSGADAARNFVTQEMDKVSKLYNKEQSFKTPEWEARASETLNASGLDQNFLKSKTGRRQVLSDINALKAKEKAAREAKKNNEKFSTSGSEKALKDAMDSNPVEKEKLTLLEKINNILHTMAEHAIGKPIDDKTSGSYGKTVAAKNTGKSDDKSSGIKQTVTADGVPIQLRENSEGGYSPDMSDSTTSEYMKDKEADRAARNGFFAKMVGAGGLIDTIKSVFGSKKEEEKPSLLSKLWEGLKSVGSGISNVISSAINGLGSIFNGGIGNVISTLGNFGTKISEKMGGFGGVASNIALIAGGISALQSFLNPENKTLSEKLENVYDGADTLEANARGYKRVHYGDDEFQRDYTVERMNKNMFKYGVLGGSKRYGKLVNKAHKGLKKGLEYIGSGGIRKTATKVASGAKGIGTKISKAGSGFLTGNIANAVGKSKTGYNLLDKAYNNKTLTALNDKGVVGFALDKGKNVASKVASGAKSVASKVASSGVGKAVSGAASSTGLTAFVGKVKDVIKKMLSALGKSADDGVLAMVDDVAKGVGQSVLKGASGLATKLSKALPFVNIVMYGLAFENGMEDALPIFQISPSVLDKPSLLMRVTSGGATLLSEVLFGILTPETCLNILMTILEAVGIADFSDIRQMQEITKQEFDEYNAQHPGEEYNTVTEYLKNVYNLYTTQDKVKKVIGGAVDTVKSGLSKAGGFIKEKASGLVQGAKDLGSKAVGAVKSFGTGAVNTVKKVGSAVGGAVSNVASGAVSLVKKGVGKVFDFAGWIKEGYTSIDQMKKDMETTFNQKETSIADVMNTKINVSDDNPLKGAIETIGLINKINYVPVLFIKGLGRKLFNDVLKPMGSKIVDTGKSVLTTVTQAMQFMAKGDPVGLLQYNTDNSVNDDSNPIGFVNSAAGIAVKVGTIVPTTISWVGHRIWDGLKTVGEGIKTVVGSIQQSATLANEYRAKGDISGLLSMDSGNQDGVLGFLSGATDLVSKIAFAGPTAFTAVGNKVKELFGTIKSGFTKIAGTVKTSSEKAQEYRKAGDIKGLLGMDSSTGEGGKNTESGPLDFISTVADVSNKITFAIPTAFTAFGNGIKSLFGKAKSTVLDIKKFIGDLWEFTDSTKHASMDDYDSFVESYGNTSDDGSIDGSVNGTIKNLIGGVMKTVIGIVRPIISFGANIKDKVFGLFDNVKDFVTGADDDDKSESGTGSGIHVSQYGSRTSNRRFGRSTVGKNGCGPAVAATVLRSYGKNADLNSTVNYAEANGYVAGSSGVGTRASYFSSILGSNGIRTSYTRNRSDIEKAVGSGNPTILLGQDRSNTSKANSPFGPNPHYVVARGTDRSGNVVIDDPELGSTALYNRRILKNSKLGIMTGGDSGIYNSASENTNAQHANQSSLGYKTSNTSMTSGKVLDANNPEDVQNYVWNFFRANGFSEAATAGIMGNINHESGFKPANIQGNGKGPAAGLFQWENYNSKSKRWANLNQYSQSKGKEWTDTQSQLEFALNEMTTSNLEGWAWKHYSKKSGVSSLDQFKQMTDISNATTAFMRTFERPNESKANLPGRQTAAINYYNKYTGSSVDPNLAITGTSSSGTTSMSSTSGTNTSSGSSGSGFDLGSMLSGIFSGVFKTIGNKIGGAIGGFISSVFGGNNSSSDNQENQLSSNSLSSFTNTGGTSTGSITGDMANNFPYYNQSDPRWGATPYGQGTISSSGCGPTSMAMVMKSYGTNVTPVETSNWSLQNGFRVNGQGTSWGFFDAIGKQNGLTTSQFSSKDTAKQYLSKNIPVIGSMRPGDFTKGGHFIVFTGYDGTNVVVNDPASKERSTKTWGADYALNQAKQFWAVSKNGQGSIKSKFGSSTSNSSTSVYNSASENTNYLYNTTATGSGLPIIDFTRGDAARRINNARLDSSRKTNINNYTGGASGAQIIQTGSSIDPQQLLQFFNQVIALLASIAQSSGYTPTIVSVLQAMTGTMSAMNSPQTQDTKNQIDNNIALMMQKLDAISQTL